ncbi:MAG TPA: tellurium resistance protein TerC [Verrucomicrobia bacterium]|nr:tellurium resistance protein TerC [Verrucomicrobiales bacterium]HIL55459.1 tellurium resistance protein TerC [Verrucomicrobiota bacterium]
MDIIGQLFTLMMLLLLQAVLGFDNLLYISIESKRAPKEKQAYVRKLGIGVAVLARIILLFLLTSIIAAFTSPFLVMNWRFVEGQLNLESIIVLFGGIFILYTAVKEIFHMIGNDHLDSGDEDRKFKSPGRVIFTIVMMNLVFSFDSILSAMALAQEPVLDSTGNPTGKTDYIMWIMATAIILSGLLMILLADKVSDFLQKNRLYEILGLFILFIVGIMLISEGAHKAHLKFFGNEIQPMTKTTFYFVIAILVLIDIVQSKFQKKLLAQKNQSVVTVTPQEEPSSEPFQP